jgi:hypothetical protein
MLSATARMWVVPTTLAGDAYERWNVRADPAHEQPKI